MALIHNAAKKLYIDNRQLYFSRLFPSTAAPTLYVMMKIATLSMSSNAQHVLFWSVFYSLNVAAIYQHLSDQLAVHSLYEKVATYIFTSGIVVQHPFPIHATKYRKNSHSFHSRLPPSLNTFQSNHTTNTLANN